MNKEKKDVIFVVLTYRNTEDLEDFFISLSSCNATNKVIIVNAFFDKETSEIFQKKAEYYQADFIEIENKGYGYGNNIGIKHAKEHYDFKYLIISNPDIELNKFSLEALKGAEKGVVGPEIIAKNGKRQNPMYYIKSTMALKLIYFGIKRNSRMLFFLGRVINKLIRDIGRKKAAKFQGSLLPVYQLHGSFVIFSFFALEKLGTVYDETMFLFAEESYLSYLLEKNRIPSFYCKEIQVYHKEDGSMQFRTDINAQLRQANVYVYEKYYHFGRG